MSKLDNRFFVDLLEMYKAQTWNCFLFWFAELAEQVQVCNLYKACKSTKNWSLNFGLIEKIIDLPRTFVAAPIILSKIFHVIFINQIEVTSILKFAELKQFWKLSSPEHPRNCPKYHIFWEGHKILRNLHLTFDWHYIGQK